MIAHGSFTRLMCMILDAPAPKDGTGKELRKLQDTVQHHLRALKAMHYEPSGPFITSVLDLKLDVHTIFEWQKHNQSLATLPHYQELLEFINLRAQALETSVRKHSLQRVKSSGHIMCPVSQLHHLRQVQVPPWIVVSYARQTSIPFMLVPNSKHKRMTNDLNVES